MDLKLTIKALLLDNIPYSKAVSELEKQIKECVDTLESPELKINADVSLHKYANKILQVGLQNIGLTNNYLLMAIGRYRNGAKTLDIVKALAPATPGELYVMDTKYAQHFEIPANVPIKNVGEMGVANQEFGKIYMERVKNALNELIDSEVKYDEHVSLRNIAEMTVRYEKTTKSLEDMKEKGINLIVTSRHENCSKRCEKWQGGHYTLDNTYQEVDGIQFIPLSKATDQYVTTKSGKTYKNGHLTGYNCRHYAIPYRKGYEPPMVDKATVEKQRAIDKRMRELERLIRRWKEKVAMFKGTDMKNEYQEAVKKVRYWKQAYITFCRANRRAIEPSRIEVF